MTLPPETLEHLKITFYDHRPVVYLIHLHTPLAHACHYVGSSCNLIERMRCYRAGNANASAFMRAVHRAGINWTLARVWTFDTEPHARDFEYLFKKGANGKQTYKSSRHCPLCMRATMAHVAAAAKRRRSAQLVMA